jgi:hypothetical protein
VGALEYYRRALGRDLENPTALYFAALAKDQLGHAREEAIPYMLKCLQLLQARITEPNVPALFADAAFNLGKFYLSTGRDDDAFVAYMAALEHQPQHTESLVSVGDHFWHDGKRDEATAYWIAALQTTPRCPEAAHYRSFLRLRLGDPDGWSDYEARWQCKMFVHSYGRPEYAGIPLWTDQPLDGQRLIVHGEQGHGDVIQCARYLPLLRDRGATVIVDLHIPAFSLPHRLGSHPSVPYLVPFGDGVDRRVGVAPEQVAWEGAFLKGEDVGDAPPRPFRVGVCWRGSKQHSNDRNRSCPVAALAPLWSIPGVEFVSLQVGDGAAEADGTPMMRVDDRITDFADTSAILASCDLTLTVDTAVAHLAGALGCPVWMMTPVLSEWRWGLEDSITPLYPSMRIFRQTTKGDWPSVVEQVRAALVELTEAE